MKITIELDTDSTLDMRVLQGLSGLLEEGTIDSETEL